MNALTTSGNGTGSCFDEPVLFIEPPRGKKLHTYVNNTLLKLAKARPNLADTVIYISQDAYSKNEGYAYSQLVKAVQRAEPQTLEEFKLSQASNRGIAALGRVFYHGYVPVALALGAKDSMQELELKKDRWSIAAQSNPDKYSEWSNSRPKL